MKRALFPALAWLVACTSPMGSGVPAGNDATTDAQIGDAAADASASADSGAEIKDAAGDPDAGAEIADAVALPDTVPDVVDEGVKVPDAASYCPVYLISNSTFAAAADPLTGDSDKVTVDQAAGIVTRTAVRDGKTWVIPYKITATYGTTGGSYPNG